jgi:Nucleotide exchange factor Fes1
MVELATVLASDETDDDLENILEKKTRALEELEVYVESIDNAKNLFIVGGYFALIACLNSRSLEVRIQAASVLVTVVQNNPKAQSWALEAGTLPILASFCALSSGISNEIIDATYKVPSESPLFGLPLSNVDDYDPVSISGLDLQASLLSALSSLVRENSVALWKIANSDDYFILFLQPILSYVDCLLENNANENSPPQPFVLKKARLCRKALFSLLQLVSGPFGEYMKTKLLLLQNSTQFLSILAKLACFKVSDRDVAVSMQSYQIELSQIREYSIGIFYAIGQASDPQSIGVVDDSDSRTITGFNVKDANGIAKPTLASNGSSASAASPVLLLANESTAVNSTNGTSSSLPAKMEVSERRTWLKVFLKTAIPDEIEIDVTKVDVSNETPSHIGEIFIRWSKL